MESNAGKSAAACRCLTLSVSVPSLRIRAMFLCRSYPRRRSYYVRRRRRGQGGICRGRHVLVTEFQGLALNGLFCADVLRPLDLVPLTDFTYKYHPRCGYCNFVTTCMGVYTPCFIQEAQLMLTTGSTRLALSLGQQTWYHSTCYI